MARPKRPLRPRLFDLVQVEWEDHEREDDWVEYSSYEITPLPLMRSVGFFLENAKEGVAIFQTADKSVFTKAKGQFQGVFTFAKGSVKNITIIKRFNKKTQHEPKYTGK